MKNNKPNPDVMSGFLEQLDKTNPELVKQFLDIASKDDILVRCLVELHPIRSFCDEDFERCLNSLDHPKNKGHYYYRLFDDHVYKIMDNNKKEILIEKLLKKENCELTVISAVKHNIIRNNQFRTETPSKLLEYALKASIKLIGQDIQIWKDYDATIAKVIKATFTRNEFHSKRFDWLHALFSAINQENSVEFMQLKVVEVTVTKFPDDFLNFLFDDKYLNSETRYNFTDASEFDYSLFSKVNIETLIDFCKERNDTEVWKSIASSILVLYIFENERYKVNIGSKKILVSRT